MPRWLGDHGRLPAVVAIATPITTSTLRSSLAVPAIVANAGNRAPAVSSIFLRP
jgi:hypothetical protein